MSAVISVRVSKRLKEDLERLGINYAEEVRRFLEELVRREKARRLRERMEEFRRRVAARGGNLSVEAVREDRDAR